MTRLAWLTDIHLDSLGVSQAQAFLDALAATEADAFVVTGDIGVADSLAFYLRLMAKRVRERPIYFVLGNHDFYGGSIEKVRERAVALKEERGNLIYLTTADVVPLGPDTCLIGHDGWYDGRHGNYHMSPVLLNDFGFINDFMVAGGFGQDRESRLLMMQALSDEAARHFMSVLPRALKDFRHVVVATHVPPFAEACLYQGRPSGGDFLPFMACKAVGDVLLQAMDEHGDKRMTVLCGHTHGGGEVWPLENLRVLTGAAAYGSPRVQGVIKVAGDKPSL